ncbi:hypothetical protein D9M68_557470 [compost metagenome]
MRAQVAALLREPAAASHRSGQVARYLAALQAYDASAQPTPAQVQALFQRGTDT